MPASKTAPAGEPAVNPAASDAAGPDVSAEQVGAGPPAASTFRRHAKATLAFTLLVLVAGAGAGAVYVVEPGETLSEIAVRNGTTVRELAKTNNLSNPDLILAGQRLIIPDADTVHVVVAGETIGEIAARYGTTASAIVSANGLRNANLIKIGQRLAIPSAGPTAGANRETAPLYHVVQRGESLASIAARHGIAVEALAAANGMQPDSVIYETTALRLTPAPTYRQPVDSSATHTVAKGETLGEIAALHSTTIRRLVRMNNLANPNFIQVGQRLTVPGGGFQCPVPGASFFNDWGFPRSGGRYHEGNDLFAPGGTPVLAPVAGRVERIDGSIGGIQFWLYGDDGNLYIGTHLSSYEATGRVKAGQVVGRVGDTGNARGARPMLHFEIMVGGEENINPYPVLKAACG